MNTISSLTGAHLRAYTALQQPASHNLPWPEIQGLLRHLGEIEEQPNGHLAVSRNGYSLVLHPAHAKDATTAELADLRRFLERSESPRRAAGSDSPHLLLVIDHHEARVFHAEVTDGRPERLRPHRPKGRFRHAHHANDFSRGQEKPDPNSFFGPVAKALEDAGQILVFGSGTGTASEMNQFVAWARVHHPDVAQRIIGAVVVDEHHLTEGQLLAKARDFYAGASRELSERGHAQDKVVPVVI